MLQSYELSESNTPQTAIQTNTAVVGAGAAELAVGALSPTRWNSVHDA